MKRPTYVPDDEARALAQANAERRGARQSRPGVYSPEQAIARIRADDPESDADDLTRRFSTVERGETPPLMPFQVGEIIDFSDGYLSGRYRIAEVTRDGRRFEARLEPLPSHLTPTTDPAASL